MEEDAGAVVTRKTGSNDCQKNTGILRRNCIYQRRIQNNRQKRGINCHDGFGHYHDGVKETEVGVFDENGNFTDISQYPFVLVQPISRASAW